VPDTAEAASKEGWEQAGARVERVAAETVIPARTVAHAAGRWPTLCLTWPAIEIEIHDDRFELYRFGPGATQNREWRCGPDSPATDTLDAPLHAAFGETA